MNEILTILLSSSAWFCGFCFIMALFSLKKVAGKNLNRILYALTACAFTIGARFYTRGESDIVSILTLSAIVYLGTLMARSGFFILKNFSSESKWYLDKEYRDALVTVGLFSAVGKQIKKRAVLDELHKEGVSLLTYTMIRNMPKGTKIPLSEEDNSYMVVTKKWYGVYLKVYLFEGCSFSKHFHDCWEFILILLGSFKFPLLKKTVRAGERITLQPKEVHAPVAEEYCELVSILIPDNLFSLLLYKIFVKPRL